MSNSNISIALVTCDRPVFFERAFSSAISQLTDGVDMIIIDDGSSQPLRVIDDDRVQVIRTGGIGRAAARNAAISGSSGDWIVFLDDDDEFAADFIEHIAKRVVVMSNGPALGIVSRTILDYDQSDQVFRKREKIFDTVIPTTRLGQMTFGIQSGLMGLIVNRQAIALAGVLDERFEHIEDTEWILRMAFCGSAVFSIPEPFVIVHNHRSEDRSTYPLRFGKRSEELKMFLELHEDMVAAEPGLEDVILSMKYEANRRYEISLAGNLFFAGSAV